MRKIKRLLLYGLGIINHVIGTGSVIADNLENL